MRPGAALVLASAIALGGCCPAPGAARAPTPPPGDGGSGSASTAPPTVPAVPAVPAVIDRARAFADAQLASLIADSLDDHRGLLAHFDPAAHVLGAGRIGGAIANLRGGALALDPHDEVLAGKLASVTAGGDARAAWISFEINLEVKAWEGATPETSGEVVRRTVRGSELLTASSGWRAVAAAFSTEGEPAPRQPAFPVDDPTAAGPLTALAADPGRAARALREDPAVSVVGFGPGERAIGPAAARALLEKIGARRPALHGKPHEVIGDGWAFVHALLDLPVAGEALPARAAVQLLALPAPGGGWQIVSAHYAAL